MFRIFKSLAQPPILSYIPATHFVYYLRIFIIIYIYIIFFDKIYKIVF